jgi:raffinose/stachyose/melibiose transport system substrate-binding protein
VFYQNGTWAYNQIKAVGDDNLGMLPIYIGVDGEENRACAPAPRTTGA